MSHRLFEILDVIELIAAHVEHKVDLASCLLVSKTFYRAFGPTLYRSVTLKLSQTNPPKHKSMPPLTVLQANAEWVRTLTLNDPFWIEYSESLVLPQLAELRLIGRVRMYSGIGIPYYFTGQINDPTLTSFTEDLGGIPSQLILRHRNSLRRLNLEGFTLPSRVSGHEVARQCRAWRTIRDLEHLQEFSIAYLCMAKMEALDAFWEICDKRQLKKLKISSIHLWGPSSRPSLSGADIDRPRRELQELILEDVKCDELAKWRLAEMVAQSENLGKVISHRSEDVLQWACQSVADQHPSAVDFSPPLSETHPRASVVWSRLLSVNVHHRKCNADTILTSVSSKLKEFVIGLGTLGPVGYQLLMDQHALTLVRLDFTTCSEVSSAMLHGILCSCPNLEHVGGDMICEEDITTPKDGPDHDPIKGREWVCRNLTTWMIPIYVNRRGDTIRRPLLQLLFRKKKSPFARPVSMVSNASNTLEANQRHWRQFQIFERLGQFRRLCVFGIASHDHSKAPPYSDKKNGLASSGVNALELRLNRGLAALYRAREIRWIYYTRSGQEFRESDLAWIVRSFPKLRNMSADMHPIPKKSDALYFYAKDLMDLRDAQLSVQR
ncbi:hypothetical protein EMPS_04332 [Entomortierella parvispora]|uniref:Uncharacterized protein n=1 Tax=Entomortierella parvispora TaxID=205924 RepID=A0A9P3H8I3_9FUNG|nr:hypothetical protein EMPS_04332 [Entomortierella parvispora]